MLAGCKQDDANGLDYIRHARSALRVASSREQCSVEMSIDRNRCALIIEAQEEKPLRCLARRRKNTARIEFGLSLSGRRDE